MFDGLDRVILLDLNEEKNEDEDLGLQEKEVVATEGGRLGLIGGFCVLGGVHRLNTANPRRPMAEGGLTN